MGNPLGGNHQCRQRAQSRLRQMTFFHCPDTEGAQVLRSTPAQVMQRLLRMSRITVPVCMTGFLISFWLGPQSILFIIAAIIASLLYSTLWLLYWKYRAESAGAIIFWLLAALAIGPSYMLARKVVFTDPYAENDLWLGLQFGTTLILVFNGIVLLFRGQILRLISRTDEDWVENK